MKKSDQVSVKGSVGDVVDEVRRVIVKVVVVFISVKDRTINLHGALKSAV